MQDLVEIGTANLKSRFAIGGAVLITLIVAWVAIALQFGSLLAEHTTPGDVNAAEIARLSAELAPDDPQAHNLLGASSEDLETAVEHFRSAVEKAPNDHRWRVALGRAYEQVEQFDKAENQLRAAATLAPNYAFPHWHLGNFYIRQGKEAEAIDELRKATADHFSFREQVFALAWDYFGRDPVLAEQMTLETPETQAYFSRFLANRGSGPDALRIWNKLGGSDKQRYSEVARWAVQDLYSKGSFVEALEMARQIGDANALAENISNPSFEDSIEDGPKARFGWEIVAGEPRVEIGFDNQVKGTGNRSLRITFRNYVRSDFANVYQTIVVKPNTSYTLRFRVRTDGLRSTSRPRLQVLSANDNSITAMSEMFAPDLGDWTLVNIPFRTGPGTNAVSIRTYRQFCGQDCALTGVLWYDDFELLQGS